MEPDEVMLGLLSELIEGRNMFLQRGINRVSPAHRDAIAARFFLNELCYLEVANRVFQHSVRREQTNASTLLTMNIPLNFLDPITVHPTAAQISAATSAMPEIPASSTCPICQDALTSNATRITHCNHAYHTTCLNSWFTMSVRCPVCRYDIRGGQAAETSSVAE
jgi:hypothetical protein